MDVVGGGGKAAGAALLRPDSGEYTARSLVRKRGAPGPERYCWPPMRMGVLIVGVLLALAGLVWMAQGLNLPFAPPSFMTADRTWIVLGAAAVLAGAALVGWARRP